MRSASTTATIEPAARHAAAIPYIPASPSPILLAYPPRSLPMPIDEQVSLKKLEVLLQFMKTGNLAETAQALGQSAVSVHRALHSLESGLRCPLFKRQGRALVPLPTALAFAEYAARALKECEEGIARAQELAGFRATRLALGCAYSVTVRTIPQLLQGLKIRRPQLDIDLKLGSTKELLEKLRRGEIDAAILAVVDDPTQDDLVGLPLFVDPIALAAPLKSRFSRRKCVDLSELRHEKFVMLQESFHTLRSQNDAFKAAGFKPNVVMRAANLFALAHLVADGVGYGLLPNRVRLFTTKVDLVPLAAPYTSHQTIMLLIPKLRERDPNLLALTAECRSLKH